MLTALSSKLVALNQTSLNHISDMFRNYFKTAWRNLTKNRVSSLINISGLAVGMAVAMLIGLWIFDELSFNKYHQNYDRIAQIMTRGVDAKEGPYLNNSVQYPLAA